MAPTLAIALVVGGACALRLNHLPRPNLGRPGLGTLEQPPSKGVEHWDTVRVLTTVLLPDCAKSSSDFLYRPAASTALVSNGSFVADARGDYVVATIPAAPVPSSACSPSPNTSAPLALFTAWDFGDVGVREGVFFEDSFSYGGVESTSTQYLAWSAIGSTPVKCTVAESNGTLVIASALAVGCGLETRVAGINPFQEAVAVQVAGVTVAGPAASSAALIRLISAYDSPPFSDLIGVSLGSQSIVVKTGNGTLFSGPGIATVCGAGGGSVNTSVAMDGLLFNLSVVCTTGGGSPVSICAHHHLKYSSWGGHASGAMRLRLEGAGAAAAVSTVTVGSILMSTLRPAAQPVSETVPLVNRGMFARPMLGKRRQPHALIGIIDVSAPPFSLDTTGTSDVTNGLQDAIDFCYTYSLLCYLPVGDYLVSDTLLLLQVWEVVGQARQRVYGLRDTNGVPCRLSCIADR